MRLYVYIVSALTFSNGPVLPVPLSLTPLCKAPISQDTNGPAGAAEPDVIQDCVYSFVVQFKLVEYPEPDLSYDKPAESAASVITGATESQRGGLEAPLQQVWSAFGGVHLLPGSPPPSPQPPFPHGTHEPPLASSTNIEFDLQFALTVIEFI